MSWGLCLSGNAILKAGVNANASIKSGATDIADYSTDAEGFICGQLNTDVVANTPTDTEIVNAISDICSSRIAMSIISYDPTGYLTREADMLMNFNDDIVTKGIAKLKEKEFQKLST